MTLILLATMKKHLQPGIMILITTSAHNINRGSTSYNMFYNTVEIINIKILTLLFTPTVLLMINN